MHLFSSSTFFLCKSALCVTWPKEGFCCFLKYPSVACSGKVKTVICLILLPNLITLSIFQAKKMKFGEIWAFFSAFWSQWSKKGIFEHFLCLKIANMIFSDRLSILIQITAQFRKRVGLWLFLSQF